MVVISAGMQKSGSAYLYNIINDLLICSGNADAREIKSKYEMDNVMKWYNNNVGDINKWLLLKLLRISFKEKKFVVKTHSEVTKSKLLNFTLAIGLVKIVYIYRDPRDVLLSAIDHGQKIISAGENHTFANMIKFEDALNNVKSWVRIWRTYKSNPKVLCINYEDIIRQSHDVVDKILVYLGIHVSRIEIERILFKYSRNNENADMHGLHFNKARINRYKEELSSEQLSAFIKELGAEIIEMGYEL